MMLAMNDEERQRRDEIHHLTEQQRLHREAATAREDELNAQLTAERLQTWREREEVKRMESQLADLRDSLQRIEGQYKADRQRHLNKVDAAVQSEASLVDSLLLDAVRRLGAGEEGGGRVPAASNAPTSADSSPHAESASHPRVHLRLSLPQPQEERQSPRSPRAVTPLSARSLSVAAALAAADRGGGGAKRAKAASSQKGAKEAERPGSRGKGAASRAATSSQSVDLSHVQREGETAKAWDGIPDI
jgi:hypothetical protein